MPALETVRVFVDGEYRFGNLLAVATDSAELGDDDCTRVARRAGTSETVFIDDPDTGRVRIFTPAGLIPFAGYPLLGAGWFLQQRGNLVTRLSTEAITVTAHVAGNQCSIDAPAGRGVPWNLIELTDPADVLAADIGGPDRHDYVWAWEDQGRGGVRARAFTSVSGTPEDEATGSAAIELCHALGRALTITQGKGSVILVSPQGSDIRLSGLVVNSA